MNLLQERLLALERKHDGNGRAGFVTNAYKRYGPSLSSDLTIYSAAPEDTSSRASYPERCAFVGKWG
jgi:hypothetical protein